MSEMVAKVHDAIERAMFGESPAEDLYEVARAAIEAMREPTEAMIDAPDSFDCDNVRRSVWVSMIDEALK